ncbi:MAG: alpha/beta hydrolase [Candidatus Eisenbacteria bacterium]|nr:alpha/beta hydrolase [Candidatus Eisenbacteria bacterium]
MGGSRHDEQDQSLLAGAGALSPGASETGRGARVLLVHGSFSWAEGTFASQSALVADHSLVLIERRGTARGQPAPRADFEADRDDLRSLLREPAHLVGHSYGAIGCLLAASEMPDQVRSLTLVEPPFYQVAIDHPAVQALLPSLASVYGLAPEVDDAEIWPAFRRALGFDDAPSSSDPAWAAAVRSARAERPPWEARLPVRDWLQFRFPRWVVSGDWANAPDRARARGGAALIAVADALARQIGAVRHVIPGAGHNPFPRPAMNDLLRQIFATGR